MKTILIVDDEKDLCDVLQMLFRDNGYEVLTAYDGLEAIEKLENGAIVDVIVSDIKMPGLEGQGLHRYLTKKGLEIPIIFITAYGTINDAVSAMKAGAVDFITKPFNKDLILHTVNKVFQIKELQNENRRLRAALPATEIVYKSKAMHEIIELMKKASDYTTPILILGESGTGKELVARSIHATNRKKPFVKIDCAAIPDTLIESELFGYEKGAFTGASSNFEGKIRLADGGVLFLDEIGELPLHLQPKLLRVLEEKILEPLGSNRSIKINIKTICATSRNLERMVEKGLFRKELLYRINTIAINIPPLRERKDDILPLAEFYLEKYTKELGKKKKRMSSDAKTAILTYNWPGNVRELRNVVERAVVLSNEPTLTVMDLPQEMKKKDKKEANQNANKLSQKEKELLIEALHNNGGNISAAARELGISRDQMRYGIRKYSLEDGD